MKIQNLKTMHIPMCTIKQQLQNSTCFCNKDIIIIVTFIHSRKREVFCFSSPREMTTKQAQGWLVFIMRLINKGNYVHSYS